MKTSERVENIINCLKFVFVFLLRRRVSHNQQCPKNMFIVFILKLRYLNWKPANQTKYLPFDYGAVYI